MALTADGSIEAWGQNNYGQCDTPTDNGFTAIAGTCSYHSLALTSDGSIMAWGYNIYGQCNAPMDSGFTAIAGGQYHSLALKSEGGGDYVVPEPLTILCVFGAIVGLGGYVRKRTTA